jgi:hypothetical protein
MLRSWFECMFSQTLLLDHHGAAGVERGGRRGGRPRQMQGPASTSVIGQSSSQKLATGQSVYEDTSVLIRGLTSGQHQQRHVRRGAPGSGGQLRVRGRCPRWGHRHDAHSVIYLSFTRIAGFGIEIVASNPVRPIRNERIQSEIPPSPAKLSGCPTGFRFLSK